MSVNDFWDWYKGLFQQSLELHNIDIHTKPLET